MMICQSPLIAISLFVLKTPCPSDWRVSVPMSISPILVINVVVPLVIGAPVCVSATFTLNVLGPKRFGVMARVTSNCLSNVCMALWNGPVDWERCCVEGGGSRLLAKMFRRLKHMTTPTPNTASRPTDHAQLASLHGQSRLTPFHHVGEDRCALTRFQFSPKSIGILRIRFLHVLPKRKEVHGHGEQERDEECPPDDEHRSIEARAQLFPPAQVRRCSQRFCNRHEDYSCHYPGERGRQQDDLRVYPRG